MNPNNPFAISLVAKYLASIAKSIVVTHNSPILLQSILSALAHGPHGFVSWEVSFPKAL